MRKLVKTLLTLSLMVPAAALALGLGEIKLHSALNQTLDADIELLSVDPAEADDIKVSLASAETFSKVGLQRPAVLMMVNFEVQRRENGTYYVKATSRETIREPFLDFLVEVEWPTGRVMREYTLLLDPPVSYQAEAPAVTTPTTTKAAPMAEAPAVKPVQAEPTVSEPPAVAEEEEEFVPPPSAIPGAAAQAPAPAPEPVAKAAPTRVEEKQAPVSRPPSSLNYGVVKANDTLWEVALKLRPNRDISVQQVMMALQRANPDAFINNNINLLKKGYVLRIDDPALLTAMSKAEAARQVARQTREWEDYRAAVAEKAEERQPAAGAEVAAGTASAAKAEPKLKLVAPDDEAAEAGSAAEGEAAGGEADEELMLALESSAAQQKENETLQARVNELEEQLQDMQRLLALKDEDLATLQEQLAEQGETSEQAAVAPQEPEEKVGDEVVVDEAVQDSQAETDGEATTPEEDGQEKPVVPEEQQEAQAEAATDEQVAEEAQEKSAEEAAAESEMTQPQEMDAETAEKPAAETEPKAAPAQPAQKADKPKPQPVAKPDAGNSSLMGYVDMLMKDPVMLAAGGGTIVLLLILTMLLIRRRSKGGGFQESILSGGTSSMLNAKADELDGETSFLSDLAISGMGGGTITTDEGEVDPLTEADVFMAYGRNQQAEEVLKKALEGNPERPELIAKLLEVYYNTGDKEQFEALINRSGDKIKGNDEHWSKIAPMGQALIPENALFGGEGAQATSPAQDSSQQAESATDEVLDIGLDLDELTSDTEMQSEAADGSLDLGMDLELDQEEKTADEPADDLSDLDFGLDLGDEAEESALTDTEFSADSFSEEGALEMDDTGAGAQAEEESPDLDFDLSGFDIEEEKPSEIAGDELADLDFGDFGVESEEQPAEEELGSFDLGTDEVAETAEDSLDLGDLDFGDFDFDSGSETETATDTAVAAEVDSGSLELDDLGAGADLDEFGDLDDEGVLSDSEEMTTKLDLAQAYIEMGDNEGARSMLEEVAESGNDEQKQQAQELLSKV